MSSRRNSITSNISISTQTSSNLPRNTSIDNLMGHEDKFTKKAMKKTPSHITNTKPISPVSNVSSSPPKPTGGSGGFHKQSGIYYFPNGEVFRPRNASNNGPPKKKIIDATKVPPILALNPILNSPKSNKSTGSSATSSPSTSGNSTVVVTGTPTTKAASSSPKKGQNINSSYGNDSIIGNSPSTSSTAAPKIPRSQSFSSFTTPSFLNKSNSVNNMKKNNLVQSIRSNTTDTPTNITLQAAAGTGHTPQKVVYQSTNIVRSQSVVSFDENNVPHTRSNSDSNPSSLSNYNLNRSSSNTPTTSINNSIDEGHTSTMNTTTNITQSGTKGAADTSVLEPVRTLDSSSASLSSPAKVIKEEELSDMVLEAVPEVGESPIQPLNLSRKSSDPVVPLDMKQNQNESAESESKEAAEDEENTAPTANALEPAVVLSQSSSKGSVPEAKGATTDTSDEDGDFKTPSNSPKTQSLLQQQQKYTSKYLDFQKDKQFEDLLNDDQEAVPPRGDLDVLSDKVRKHERNSSSLSSFNDIIDKKKDDEKSLHSEVETIKLKPKDQSESNTIDKDENEATSKNDELPVAESSPISIEEERFPGANESGEQNTHIIEVPVSDRHDSKDQTESRDIDEQPIIRVHRAPKNVSETESEIETTETESESERDGDVDEVPLSRLLKQRPSSNIRHSTMSDMFEGFPIEVNSERPVSTASLGQPVAGSDTPDPSPNIEAYSETESHPKRSNDRSISPIPSRGDAEGMEYEKSASSTPSDKDLPPVPRRSDARRTFVNDVFDEEDEAVLSIPQRRVKKHDKELPYLNYSTAVSSSKNLVLPSPIAEESASALTSPTHSNTPLKSPPLTSKELKSEEKEAEPTPKKAKEKSKKNASGKPTPQLPPFEPRNAANRASVNTTSLYAPSFSSARTSFIGSGPLNLNEFNPPMNRAMSPISPLAPSFATAHTSFQNSSAIRLSNISDGGYGSGYTMNSPVSTSTPSFVTLNGASEACSIRAIKSIPPTPQRELGESINDDVDVYSEIEEVEGDSDIEASEHETEEKEGKSNGEASKHPSRSSNEEVQVDTTTKQAQDQKEDHNPELHPPVIPNTVAAPRTRDSSPGPPVSTPPPKPRAVQSLVTPTQETNRDGLTMPPSKFKPTPPTPPSPPIKSLLNDSINASPAVKSIGSEFLPSPTVKSMISDSNSSGKPPSLNLQQQINLQQQLNAPRTHSALKPLATGPPLADLKISPGSPRGSPVSSIPPTPPQKSPKKTRHQVPPPNQPFKSMLDDSSSSQPAKPGSVNSDFPPPSDSLNSGQRDSPAKPVAKPMQRLNKARSTPNLPKSTSANHLDFHDSKPNATNIQKKNIFAQEYHDDSHKPGFKKFFKKIFTAKNEKSIPIAAEVSINTSCNGSFVSNESAGGVSLSSLLKHTDSNYRIASKESKRGGDGNGMGLSLHKNHSTPDFGVHQKSQPQEQQQQQQQRPPKSPSPKKQSRLRSRSRSSPKADEEDVAPAPPPKIKLMNFQAADSMLDDLTLTKLPTIERDTEMFSDILTSFDEKFNRNSIFSKVDTPFLKDDELTKDQIEDQQKKDNLDSLKNSKDDLPLLPPKDIKMKSGLANHSRSNSEEVYIDDNILFLQNEVIWFDEMKSIASVRTRKDGGENADNEDGENNDDDEDDILDTILNTGDEYIDVIYNDENGRQYSIRRNKTFQESTYYLFPDDETETINIDNEQLNNLFNNLTEAQRRQLPMHLKYIKQFKDYDNLEITIKTGRKRIVKGQQPAKPTLKRFQYPPNVKRKNVAFGNKIYVNETYAPELYKRYNKSVTQYTLTEPHEINKIKTELNQYKCNEMLVHEQSQNNTHFFY